MNEVRQQKMGSILAKDCNFSDIPSFFFEKSYKALLHVMKILSL